MKYEPLYGTIFNIQRYSIHDGPGIRTLVFMKGCPISCIWCANPEGQYFKPALQFLEKKCVGCYHCVPTCPEGAITITSNGIYWDKEYCQDCFQCVSACLYGARERCGTAYSVDELLKIIARDSTYYRKSGGGVTFSGGEPLSQQLFVTEALRRCKQEYGYNTAIETCGYYPWEHMRQALPYLNTIYMDLKLMDTEEHKKYTGVNNQQIIENIRLTAQSIDPSYQELIIRTPVIPGINFYEEKIRQMTEFILTCDTIKRYELLPYHNYGEAKWERTKWTGPYTLHDVPILQAEDLQLLKEMVKSMGLTTN